MTDRQQTHRLIPCVAVKYISVDHAVCRDHNVISDVKQVPLTSLPSLRVVDLSHNRLTRLDNDSFPFTTQLRHL